MLFVKEIEIILKFKSYSIGLENQQFQTIFKKLKGLKMIVFCFITK